MCAKTVLLLFFLSVSHSWQSLWVSEWLSASLEALQTSTPILAKAEFNGCLLMYTKKRLKVRANEQIKTSNTESEVQRTMGYVLLLLFFLVWRNMVQIKKATNYIAYGTEHRKGKISKLLDLITNIHNEEAEARKAKRAKRQAEREEKEHEEVN